MKHLDDGALRRLLDEPLSQGGSHLAACERCRRRSAEIARDAAEARRLLAMADSPVELAPALARMRARTSIPHMNRVERTVAPEIPRRRVPLLAALAACLVAGLAFTPAGSWAQSLVTIFQPRSVAAVPVSLSDLRALPHLARFGTFHTSQKGRVQPEPNAAAAGAAAGMTVLTPSSLPSSLPAPTFDFIPGSNSTFTFSAAKAAAAAARAGRPLPPMPANINGSTLTLSTGNAVAAIYGNLNRGVPDLVIGQMVAPRVSSTGITAQQLEDYLVSLPGVSPQLASALRGIADPTSTLPIPIPVNLAQADRVTVQGVQGMAVGDATGVGSAVIWVKQGIVYAVAGALPESQVEQIANSVH